MNAAIDTLRTMGVDFVQGFAIARPEPVEIFLNRHGAAVAAEPSESHRRAV